MQRYGEFMKQQNSSGNMSVIMGISKEYHI